MPSGPRRLPERPCDVPEALYDLTVTEEREHLLSKRRAPPRAVWWSVRLRGSVGPLLPIIGRLVVFRTRRSVVSRRYVQRLEDDTQHLGGRGRDDGRQRRVGKFERELFAHRPRAQRRQKDLRHP